MAGFRLTKPYTMSKEEVREAAQGLATSLEQEHGVRSRWEGDSVRITGAGVDGKMSFHEVLRSEVQRSLDTHVS